MPFLRFGFSLPAASASALRFVAFDFLSTPFTLPPFTSGESADLDADAILVAEVWEGVPEMSCAICWQVLCRPVDALNLSEDERRPDSEVQVEAVQTALTF